ncbi:hypothetical protein V1523DRAFT_413101 [Lipomyces doorenjongii]
MHVRVLNNSIPAPGRVAIRVTTVHYELLCTPSTTIAGIGYCTSAMYMCIVLRLFGRLRRSRRESSNAQNALWARTVLLPVLPHFTYCAIRVLNLDLPF